MANQIAYFASKCHTHVSEKTSDLSFVFRNNHSLANLPVYKIINIPRFIGLIHEMIL
ncbi:protein of unknown function [Candidatus Nitrosocosmicus franklandus]|uniref:Uncharacterized protein n=1 Tax=Candidatus Nitrosocosmicus franklandianus TaxID=1798806 RepID=A0A484IGJ6_9ARCH|nr:protein of unknown function [Candidatus Nitrosocosmicus franklandus]